MSERLLLVVAALGTLGATPTEVTFESDGRALHGWLWVPAGDGPFPAIVYNHGSEKSPGTKPEIADWGNAHGYVVFVPHRRGQGDSPGPYMDDEEKAGSNGANVAIRELYDQVDDVLAAVAWLRAEPEVDPNRVALAGCSFGGIETILAAARADGVRAAVDYAGASMSWRNSPTLRANLLDEVVHTRVPIFLLQAQNDWDTEPTVELGAALAAAGKPYRAELYPPYGKTHTDGHGGFCTKGEDLWGEDVATFLSDALKP